MTDDELSEAGEKALAESSALLREIRADRKALIKQRAEDSAEFARGERESDPADLLTAAFNLIAQQSRQLADEQAERSIVAKNLAAMTYRLTWLTIQTQRLTTHLRERLGPAEDDEDWGLDLPTSYDVDDDDTN